MENELELHPMSLGDMLDISVGIFVRRPFLIFGLGLIQQSPTMVFNQIYPGGLTPEQSRMPEEVGIYLLILAVTMSIFMLVVTVTSAMMTQLIASIFLNRPFSIRESIAFVTRRIFRLIWLSFLIGLIMIGGFVPFILPGLLVMLLLVLATPACILEDIPARRAVARSIQLMKWVQGPLRLLGLYAIIFFMTMVIVGPIAGLMEADMLRPRVAVLLIDSFNIISTIFLVTCIVLLYVDQRVRREGLDLLLLAQTSPVRA